MRAAYVALGLMDVVETSDGNIDYKQTEHGDGLSKVMPLEEEGHVFLEPSIYLDFGCQEVADKGIIYVDSIIRWVKDVKSKLKSAEGLPIRATESVNDIGPQTGDLENDGRAEERVTEKNGRGHP